MVNVPRRLRFGRDAATDFATWRPGRTTSEGTYFAARSLHRRTAGRSSAWALKTLRARHGLTASASLDDLPTEWRDALDRLDVDGITTVPEVLDAEAVERIRQFASTAPAVLRSTDGSTRRGTLADRDEMTAAVTIVEQFVLDQPDIQGLIANSEVWRFASARFGATPLMHPPTLYWTLAGATVTDTERKRGARQFHWDYDGLQGVRVHLYLTDVDEGSAPMSYVRGSQRPGTLTAGPLRRGDFGVPEDALWAAFPREALQVMTGPAGTMFISDSHGLHSGSDALSSDRLFLVMPAQASGFAGYQLRPRAVTPRDPAFSIALRDRRPELTFFRDRSAGSR